MQVSLHASQISGRLLDMGYSKKEKEKMLRKGLAIYKADPAKLNHHRVANELCISNAKVHYHFKDLKEAVLEYAVEKGDAQVIVQLLASNHPLVEHISAAEKQKYFKSI